MDQWYIKHVPVPREVPQSRPAPTKVHAEFELHYQASVARCPCVRRQWKMGPPVPANCLARRNLLTHSYFGRGCQQMPTRLRTMVRARPSQPTPAPEGPSLDSIRLRPGAQRDANSIVSFVLSEKVRVWECRRLRGPLFCRGAANPRRSSQRAPVAAAHRGGSLAKPPQMQPSLRAIKLVGGNGARWWH